jgi:pimeloyl-ACP methyl ester carboxylesterase
MERGDYNDVLPVITVPTLVMAGWNDFLTPAREAERMASVIPGAELHVLDDCGHLCPVEQPRAVGGIVAHFLEAAQAREANPSSHRN